VAAAALAAGALAAAGLFAVGPATAATPYTPSTITQPGGGLSVVFTPDGSSAYVVNATYDEVNVIDTATQTVTSSIDVGDYPGYIAMAPNGGEALVTNGDGASVSVIDTSSQTVTATISVAAGPTDIAFSPDGTKAYVLSLGDGTGDGTLSVIDVATNSVTATTSVPRNPQVLTISPNGDDAYVASALDENAPDNGTLSVIDLATLQTTTSITVGMFPDSIAETPDGSDLLVTNFGGLSAIDEIVDGTVSVISTSSDQVTSTIDLGDYNPETVAISADGSTAYVAEGPGPAASEGNVAIISVGSGTLSQQIPIPGLPLGLAISPDGSQVYVTNLDSYFNVINVPAVNWSPTTPRLSGADRYATSVAVAHAGFPSTASIAYIATGTDFPDALSAAAAAAKLGGPLLLTTPTSLPASVVTQLQSLQPPKIYVAGGASAVSAGVFNALTTLAAGWHGKVYRQSGVDRFATSLAIVGATFTSSTKVYIATGDNFPDALSASAAAGAQGIPVVLVNGSAASLDSQTLSALRSLGATQFLIAGGTSAVSAGIATSLQSLGTVTRYAGADRYATSELINKAAFPHPTQAFYATGSQFPDALSGAVLAATSHSPLYVVQPDCVPNQTENDLAAAGTSKVTLIGGTSALGADLETQANCASS
jgi:YVTN family beta-propeller protein